MEKAAESVDGRYGMRLTEMTQQLMVLCPNCDKWFASAIQMDPETWESMRMQSGLMERCAHCGVATRFAKVEYQFRPDEDELDG
jgi:RNase P subunit RPR2